MDQRVEGQPPDGSGAGQRERSVGLVREDSAHLGLESVGDRPVELRDRAAPKRPPPRPHLARQLGARAGRLTVKVVPCSASDSTSTVPLCARTTSLTMYRPRPMLSL